MICYKLLIHYRLQCNQVEPRKTCKFGFIFNGSILAIISKLEQIKPLKNHQVWLWNENHYPASTLVLCLEDGKSTPTNHAGPSNCWWFSVSVEGRWPQGVCHSQTPFLPSNLGERMTVSCYLVGVPGCSRHRPLVLTVGLPGLAFQADGWHCQRPVFISFALPGHGPSTIKSRTPSDDERKTSTN